MAYIGNPAEHRNEKGLAAAAVISASITQSVPSFGTRESFDSEENEKREDDLRAGMAVEVILSQ